MVSTLLIYLYVSHEFSYDKFHEHADRIYRVNQTFIWGEGDNNQFGSTGPGVALALKEELPEVELVSSIHTPGHILISYTNERGDILSFEEERVLAVDSNFFKMFTFPLIHGQPASVVRQANTMVMTEQTARRYFGDSNPVGKLVRVTIGKEEQTYEVTGVTENTPQNSYIEYDALLSMTSFPQVKRMYWSWVWTQLETYVRLAENNNLRTTEEKLRDIPRKHAEVTMQRVMNTSYDEYIKSGKKWELFLQPLTSIHLPDNVVYNRLQDPGNIVIVYSLVGAAIFIVLLSCINFINLSTAQFTRKIKEASIRKILGIGRLELIMHYFLEALTFCLLAFLLAVAATQLVLPAFSTMSGIDFHLNWLEKLLLIPSIVGFLLLISLIAGIYPALFLSAFRPAEALKGKVRSSREGRPLRNGLVIFQFSISFILIICTMIVFEQLNYIAEKDLGFNKENLLVINRVESLRNGESLANEAATMPGVTGASWCSSLPPTIWGGDKFTAEGTNNKTFSLNYTTADESYIPTLGIQLKIGRNFSKDNPADMKGVILNEKTVERLGWKLDESSLGKKIELPGSDLHFEVIGIMADFNYWSLVTPIEPMAVFHMRSEQVNGVGDRQFIAVRIRAQDSNAWKITLASLETLWKKHAPGIAFQYAFVDQAFAETFRTQEQFSIALTVMAGLAILIAGLGLLAMIVYTLEHRTKEIGIRKVSGASVWNILTMISASYTRLIVIAFFIGAPAAWWMMQQWLQGFAHRVTPSIWLMAVVGIATLLGAMAITGYHSVKAALTNPVDVLKDE